MINNICGLIAMIVLTLFAGGLAYSIWQNAASTIAFPVIVAIVLVMAYRSYYDEIKTRR